MRDRELRQNGLKHAVEAWRTAAEVDADRVFYSPEFRRLSGVTQVVPPQDGYHFHERLSHSLKVAQIAATLARQVVSQSSLPADVDVTEWVDPEYCYVAGLVHDIGHPPFGHAGEQQLQRLLEGASSVAPAPTTSIDAFDLPRRSFEGNAQSTRIVTLLSFRKDVNEPGLNLTLRSLAGIAKYPWLRFGHPHSISKLRDKWSFYPGDAGLLEELHTEGFVHTEIDNRPDGSKVVVAVHRWPEAEIMDWADDITYAVHDLEDFFRADLTPLSRIGTGLREAEAERARAPFAWRETDFTFVTDLEVRACLIFARDKLNRLILPSGALPTHADIDAGWTRLLKDIASRLPDTPFDGSRRAHAVLQSFGSTMIGVLTAGASLVYNPDTSRVQLAVEPEEVVIAEIFKSINMFFVVKSATLATMQHGQADDLAALYKALLALAETWLAGGNDEAEGRRLPSRLRQYIREARDAAGPRSASDMKAAVGVAVVDYICSLRDIQAVDLAARLKGSREAMTISSRWLDT